MGDTSGCYCLSLGTARHVDEPGLALLFDIITQHYTKFTKYPLPYNTWSV